MIYENIKKICIEKKISISGLEKKAGLSNGSISKWRTSKPTIDKLQAVANALNVKVGTLLKE